MKLSRFVYENRWFDSIILVVFILAFAGATYNHMMDIISGGFFPYTKKWGTPESLNLYWTSLTILDPLAIAALIINVRAGYVMALCIMFTDVPINLYANTYYWPLPLYENYSLLMQLSFLIFLLSTVHRIWKRTATNDKRKI